MQPESEFNGESSSVSVLESSALKYLGDYEIALHLELVYSRGECNKTACAPTISPGCLKKLELETEQVRIQ